MRNFLILPMILTLGACSHTAASLHYEPSVPIVAVASPTIASVSAQDQRKERPTQLATIMGGYGNPLKTLDTIMPVKDEVAAAFSQGLRVRAMLAPDAAYRLQLLVTKFDSDMYINRGARIDVTLSVVDAAGRTIYQDHIEDKMSELKFFETGIFADIHDLQVMSEQLLSRTVDRMLDNPGFRAAVAGARVAMSGS